MIDKASFGAFYNTLLDDLLRADGIDQVGTVYVAHCPMAYDYEGADWLTTKAEIRNPYFGAEMLSCGTLTESLSFDAESVMTSEPGVDPHAKHKH